MTLSAALVAATTVLPCFTHRDRTNRFVVEAVAPKGRFRAPQWDLRLGRKDHDGSRAGVRVDLPPWPPPKTPSAPVRAPNPTAPPRGAWADFGLFRELWHELYPKLHYIPATQLQLVKDALAAAVATLGTEVGPGNRLAIRHPLAIASLMADIQQDAATVAAAILRGSVGPGKLSVEDVRKAYGNAVGNLIDGTATLSKLPPLVLGDADEEQAENLRQMFIVMAEDWRIILLHLAARLDVLRHLDARPIEEQQRLAEETLSIYAPLAHRLGIWDLKTELEELGFMYRRPLQHALIKQKMQRRLQGMEDALDGGGLAIRLKLLEDDPFLLQNNVTLNVKGRIKGVYSVWAKMHFSNRSFEGIKDLMAVRVVLDIPRRSEESDVTHRLREEAVCYHAMAIIQSIPSLCCDQSTGKVKDYVASPKANGYQSLHTMVAWKGHLIEVQVRSRSMHHIAEFGLAAHWVYKDQRKDLTSLESYRVAWLDPILRWKRAAAPAQPQDGDQLYSPKEFLEVVRRELLGKRVLVFTPSGRIVNLPKGSTVLNAMDHLHPSISPLQLRAEVNGVPVPVWYTLQTGQTLEVTLRPKRINIGPLSLTLS